MRILFVGRKFGNVAGGVERTAIALMNAMCARGHEISLLTWDYQDAKSHYRLDPSVRWLKLDMGDALQKAPWPLRFQRQFRIRALVTEIAPDVIIGFQHGSFLTVRLATLGLGVPTIAAERNAPQRFDYIKAGRYRNLIFFSFLLAAKITVQFEEYRQHYPWFLRNKIVHVPNPISSAKKLATPQGTRGGPKTLLFVGHLSYQKNPEVLLKAFEMLANDFQDWHLSLVGNGEYKERLEKTIARSQYAQKIRLLGVFQDIENAYQQANLFCLPSLWEGFPNALGEALAHGLPAVGFSECAGVNMLIKPGVNGLLAPGNSDPHALAGALRELMSAPERRAEMGREAIRSVRRYDPNEVFQRWEDLFFGIKHPAKRM